MLWGEVGNEGRKEGFRGGFFEGMKLSGRGGVVDLRWSRRTLGWLGFGLVCLYLVVNLLFSSFQSGDALTGEESVAMVKHYRGNYVRFGKEREMAVEGSEGREVVTGEDWKGTAIEVDANLDFKELRFNSSNPTVGKFRLVVMTMDRPWSLDRLLKSINEVNFLGDEVILDIWIDRAKNGVLDDKVLTVAREFEFRHGRKVIYKRTVNAGLFRQWVFTWTPSDVGEEAILLEDDLEVSPHFYTWLKGARQRYAKHTDVAAFTLQRAKILCSKYHDSLQMKVSERYPVFFYELLGSWGCSPNRKHWKEFAVFFRAKAWDPNFHPYVDGLIMTEWYKKQEGKHTMWTQFFIYWCELNGYYNGYANLPNERTLASNWQETGLHYDRKVNSKEIAG